MPTSSQALILLNSELDSSLGLYSTKTRRAVTSTAGLMLSSLAIGVSQEQINATATTNGNEDYNMINNHQENGTMTLTSSNPLNARMNNIQQVNSLQKGNIWVPQNCSSTNQSHNLNGSSSAQGRSLAGNNEVYSNRQAPSLNGRPYQSAVSYDKCQQNIATTIRDSSDEVWPVLEVRKSQQFYRPQQTLNVSASNGDLSSLHSNFQADGSLSERNSSVVQPMFSKVNHRFIQRLRELGFRSHGHKSQDGKILNVDCKEEAQLKNEGLKKKLDFALCSFLRKEDKDSLDEEARSICIPSKKLETSVSLQCSEINENVPLFGNNFQSMVNGQLESSSDDRLCRWPGRDNAGPLEREETQVDALEREKVDQLVAHLQAGMRQKKYKPPSIRMRKELPESRPLTVCFGSSRSDQLSHEEIKRELECQYPDVRIVSLQFDPVSVAVGDPSTHNRWIVSLSKQDDCETMIKGGILLMDGRRARVRPLDDVMREEHNAYKLHQYVQEAKAKVSLIKEEDTSCKGKRSRRKAKPKKKKKLESSKEKHDF